MLPLTVWPLLFVRMNRAQTADRFRYLGEVQGPDSPGARESQLKFVLLASSGIPRQCRSGEPESIRTHDLKSLVGDESSSCPFVVGWGGRGVAP